MAKNTPPVAEKPWDYTTGEKGLNRVRVYERRPGGPIWICIYVKGKAYRESLSNLNDGTPIFDRELAKEIADAIAMDRRQRAEAKTARAILNRPIPYTLHELLAELHETRESTWKNAHYKQQQRAIRDWWLNALGRDVKLTDVDAATVTRAINAEAKRKKWTDRTRAKYMRYLKDAFIFAWRDKKWIAEEHNLSELKLPKQKSARKAVLAYTEDEMVGILAVAPEKDLRMAAAAHIAYITLSRINAILHLRTDDVVYSTINGQRRMRLRFRAEIEKRDEDGFATLDHATQKYVEMLMQRPLIQSCGWLFARGDLDKPNPSATPLNHKVMSDWIKWCEARAEVPRIEGRGWHSIKRGGTKIGGDETGSLRAAAKQARTTEATLRAHYDQDSPEAQADFADQLSARLARQLEARRAKAG